MEFQETYQLKTSIDDFNFSNCVYELEKEKRNGFLEHCHSCYEIEYNITGSSLQVLGDRMIEVPEKAIFFAPPLEIHATAADLRERHGIFQFNSHILKSFFINASERTVFETAGELRENGFYRLPDGSRSMLCMERLISVVSAWRLDAHPTVEEATALAKDINREFRELSALFSFLDALMEEGQLRFVELAADSTELEDFSPLINRILNSPGYQFDMHAAAEMCHMNYSYFSRKFKKVFGHSYTDYINILRIDKAKRLLKEKDKSLRQIAEELEFGSEYYFNRVFKEYAGVAPSRYRKMQRD